MGSLYLQKKTSLRAVLELPFGNWDHSYPGGWVVRDLYMLSRAGTQSALQRRLLFEGDWVPKTLHLIFEKSQILRVREVTRVGGPNNA